MRRWIIVVLMSLFFSLTVTAQNAPEQINAAYADLSARVGVSLNTDNSAWRWEQRLFNNNALDCAVPVGGAPVEVVAGQIVGYVFTLGYAGKTYEYHVSLDSTIVVLCQQYSTDSPPVDPDEPVYSNPLCGIPEDGVTYLRNRIAFDTQGLAINPAGNTVRDGASVNNLQIGTITTGSVFRVISAPVCDDDGLIWWQVDYDGQIGWTAEYFDGEYLIEPFPGQPFTLTGQPFTLDNVTQIGELSRLQGNINTALEWSPDGNSLYVAGNIGAEGVWVYDMTNVELPPRIVEQDLLITSMDAFNDGERILIGTTAGDAHILDIRADATLIERLFLNSYERDVTDVILPNDETTFLIAGTNALTNAVALEDRTNAILQWDLASVSQQTVITGATSTIVDMSYTDAGIAPTSQLAVVDVNGQATWFTDMNNLQSISIPEGTYNRATFSANAQFLALAQSNGSINLYDAVTQNLIATYTGHLGNVTDMLFTSDNAMLMSIGDDGSLYVWNLATHTQAHRITVSDQPLREMTIRPQNDLIAVTVADNTIRLIGLP